LPSSNHPVSALNNDENRMSNSEIFMLRAVSLPTAIGAPD